MQSAFSRSSVELKTPQATLPQSLSTTPDLNTAIIEQFVREQEALLFEGVGVDLEVCEDLHHICLTCVDTLHRFATISNCSVWLNLSLSPAVSALMCAMLRC